MESKFLDLENRIILYVTDVEDEYHFFKYVPSISDIRKLYIEQYFWKRPSVHKLNKLSTSENAKELYGLGIYLHKSEKLRNDILLKCI